MGHAGSESKAAHSELHSARRKRPFADDHPRVFLLRLRAVAAGIEQSDFSAGTPRSLEQRGISLLDRNGGALQIEVPHDGRIERLAGNDLRGALSWQQSASRDVSCDEQQNPVYQSWRAHDFLRENASGGAGALLAAPPAGKNA